VLKDLKERKVQKDLKVNMGLKENKVPKAPKGLKEFQVRP
jgi:hypothetical protein